MAHHHFPHPSGRRSRVQSIKAASPLVGTEYRTVGRSNILGIRVRYLRSSVSIQCDNWSHSGLWLDSCWIPQFRCHRLLRRIVVCRRGREPASRFCGLSRIPTGKSSISTHHPVDILGLGPASSYTGRLAAPRLPYLLCRANHPMYPVSELRMAILHDRNGRLFNDLLHPPFRLLHTL